MVPQFMPFESPTARIKERAEWSHVELKAGVGTKTIYQIPAVVDGGTS